MNLFLMTESERLQLSDAANSLGSVATIKIKAIGIIEKYFNVTLNW